jgi:hypothetical protein
VFETNNLYPFRHTLAYNVNLLGVTALVLPVQYVWENPTLTHNVALLLCLIIGGWGTFLLVRELCGSWLAGLLGGALVIYSPETWSRVTLLNVLASHWTPIALFALVKIVKEQRWRWSILLGVVAALQTWSSLHHGLFLALGLSVATGVLLLTSPNARKALAQLAAAGLLAMVLCVPLVLPYRTVWSEMEISKRPGAARFSLAAQWMIPAVGQIISFPVDRLRNGERIRQLACLVPWFLMLAGGVVAGLMRRPRYADARILLALGAAGLANLYLALGPKGVVYDWKLPSLYAALTYAPGFSVLRAPMRASAFTQLVLCVLAACGAHAVLRRLPGWKTRAAVGAFVLALIVIEAGWRPVYTQRAPSNEGPALTWIRELRPACPIAEIPTRYWGNARALFRSTAHWRPLINGYGFPLARLSAVLNRFPAQDAIDFLHAAGACAVIVHRQKGYDSEQFARVLRESRAQGLRVRATADEAIVEIGPPPALPDLGPVLSRNGWRPTAGHEDSVRLAFDGDLTTAWTGLLQEGDQPDRLEVDLGTPAVVTGLALELGPHFRRYLRSYRVQGSPDGATWTTLAEDPMAVPPLASYRADHHRIRQVIALPPTRVQQLRIGPYRKPPPRGLQHDARWTLLRVSELQVYGSVASDPDAGSAGLQ